MEQVALLAQQNTLPEPTLDISMLSYSAASHQSLTAAAAYSNSNSHPDAAQSVSAGTSSSAGSAAVLRSSTSAAAVAPPPPPDDPWMTGARYGAAVAATAPFGAGAAGLNGGGAPPSSVSGTGLPSGWWRRLEKVTVLFAGQQGFVLNRYMVYGITTEVRHMPPIVGLWARD